MFNLNVYLVTVFTDHLNMANVLFDIWKILLIQIHKTYIDNDEKTDTDIGHGTNRD